MTIFGTNIMRKALVQQFGVVIVVIVSAVVVIDVVRGEVPHAALINAHTHSSLYMYSHRVPVSLVHACSMCGN